MVNFGCVVCVMCDERIHEGVKMQGEKRSRERKPAMICKKRETNSKPTLLPRIGKEGES